MNIHAIPNNSKFKVEMIPGHKTQSRSYSDYRLDLMQTALYLWIFCWVKISNVVHTKLLSMRSMVFCLGDKSHLHSERRERLRWLGSVGWLSNATKGLAVGQRKIPQEQWSTIFHLQMKIQIPVFEQKRDEALQEFGLATWRPDDTHTFLESKKS